MSDLDAVWIQNQFKRVRTPEHIQQAVIDLLVTWDELEIEGIDKTNALGIFTELAQGNPLKEEEQPNEVWVEVSRVNLNLGDTVRVKLDAFGANLAAIHNGRRGKVIGLRSGDIIVRSTDGLEPYIDSAHYPPNILEKRVR